MPEKRKPHEDVPCKIEVQDHLKKPLPATNPLVQAVERAWETAPLPMKQACYRFACLKKNQKDELKFVAFARRVEKATTHLSEGPEFRIVFSSTLQ